jgi:hypothetical protein
VTVELQEDKGSSIVTAPPELMAAPLRAAPVEARGAAVAEAPAVYSHVPPARTTPRRRRIPVGPFHLGLAFASGFFLLLGLAALGYGGWLQVVPPDTVIIRDLGDQPTGTRVALGELSIVNSKPVNPYLSNYPLLTVADREGNHVFLINRGSATLVQGQEVHGMSARVMRVGDTTVLVDPVVPWTDPEHPEPFFFGGAFSLVVAAAAAWTLRQNLRPTR